jgi:hypothetical protein
MLGCYPVMPLAPSCGLSVATVTMGGTVGVGVTSDPVLFRRMAAWPRRSRSRSTTCAGRPGRGLRATAETALSR